MQDITMEKQTPPPLRDAATIILAREKNETLEIYLLKRSDQSGFMGGLYVFPGGVVDDQDRGAGTWLPHIDLTDTQLDASLCDSGFTMESAVAFGVAAIRETLEEAGVLIASKKQNTKKSFQEMAALRLQKGLSPDWFQSSIREGNWSLLFSHLGRWSHWITPKRMKKRFDTRFFIVLMPENQTCVPDDHETKEGIWAVPQTALEQNLSGNIPLSPPTVVTLTQLAVFKTLSELKKEMHRRSWGNPIAPVMLPSDDGPVIIEPWDRQFAAPDTIDLSDLPQKVLPPGAPFSRIWCDKGMWKPVKD